MECFFRRLVEIDCADINLSTCGCVIFFSAFVCSECDFRLECEHCYIFLAKIRTDQFVSNIYSFQHSHTWNTALLGLQQSYSNFHFMSPSWRPYHFLCPTNAVSAHHSKWMYLWISLKGHVCWFLSVYIRRWFFFFFLSSRTLSFWAHESNRVESLFHVNQAIKKKFSQLMHCGGKSTMTSKVIRSQKKFLAICSAHMIQFTYTTHTQTQNNGTLPKRIIAQTYHEHVNLKCDKCIVPNLITNVRKASRSVKQTGKKRRPHQRQQQPYDHNKWS